MAQSIKSVVLPNKQSLSYIEQGDPTDDSLILLHGIADSCIAFEPVLPYIPDSIHAFALSQRGHGDASRPESGYRTTDFASDLMMFMNALHIEKAIILGASSGGFAARRFAIDHPERTSGLVLLGSPSVLRGKKAVEDIWNTVFSNLTDPVDPEFVRGFTMGLISKNVPPEFLEKMIKENLKVPAHVWRETFKGLLEETFPGDINKIRTQTLVIWGDQDIIISRSDQESITDAIAGSRLIVHASAGHLLYWEEPDRVASDIVAFINEITLNNPKRF